MLDLEGCELAAEERELLAHPNVGGVILFSRNYECPEQLTRLTRDIHAIGRGHMLVAVDQEGGRVQRFREEFTVLPPVRRLGDVYDRDRAAALELARSTGWLMAAELLSVGIDFSFAPVLDLDRGVSEVIGERAFHHHPDAVGDLAQAYIGGMAQAGMAATCKHFPGHGSVVEDSHHALPVDNRALADLRMLDLIPFERMIRHGVAGIMPAHVRYAQMDQRPASFSSFWLRDVLRAELGFQGLIFSDDLSMAAAANVGDPLHRARQALAAGCDILLLCNDRAAALRVVESLPVEPDPLRTVRRAPMHGHAHSDFAALRRDARWRSAVEAVQQYRSETPSRGL